MKKLAIILSVAALVAAPALADSYSWEDGTGTIFGSYGALADATNVSGAQGGLIGSIPGSAADFTCPGAHTGERYLHVAEEPHDGTPQAYIAWITGLEEGDVVDASYFGFDSVADYPSLRIWGHYATNDDVMAYSGSAGGSNTYTSGIGWEELSHSWTIPAGQEALVIEARLYSTPTTDPTLRTDYFIDDVSVTAPETAVVHFVPEPASLILLGLAGLLIRRR